MAMALHVVADHRAVEDVHRGEQRRRSVPLVVMCHRSGAALLQRQSGLRAVQRLNLAFSSTDRTMAWSYAGKWVMTV